MPLLPAARAAADAVCVAACLLEQWGRSLHSCSYGKHVDKRGFVYAHAEDAEAVVQQSYNLVTAVVSWGLPLPRAGLSSP